MAGKKWLIPLGTVSLLALTLPVCAHYGHFSYHGVYIGAQGGYGNTHYDSDLFQDANVREHGVAGRIYLGNQFNEYLAVELGATQFSFSDIENDFGKVKTSELELLFRFGAPIPCSLLRADLKVGVADVFADIDPTDKGVAYGIQHEFTTEFRPLVGLSLSLNVTRHFAIDASYMHLFGNPTSESHLAPNNDLFALGVSYLFTNP